MLNRALPHQVSLLAHPSTPSEAVQSLHVQLLLVAPKDGIAPKAGAGPGLLTLHYNLGADMSRIRVGSETVPGRAEGLWKHTCFEAFIQPGGLRPYFELNFSPTRQWAAYGFDGYREGMRPIDLSNPPEITVRHLPHQLELQATFSLPASVTTGVAPGCRLALTAVVEEENGRLCYWSARHPQGKPDFHHADNFVLEL
jgi:hypothetical protein